MLDPERLSRGMSKRNAQEKVRKVKDGLRLHRLPRPVRLVVVGVVGAVFLLAGIVMIFTPGPAFIFIPLGLLCLASEFPWAERWLDKTFDALDAVRAKWHARKRRRAAQPKS